MSVTADFRADVTLPDGTRHKPVRFVFLEGNAAIWRTDGQNKEKVHRRIVYVNGQSATFVKKVKGRVHHQLHVTVEGSDEPEVWNILQLPPPGCGCNKIAAGYNATQLLEPDRTEI